MKESMDTAGLTQAEIEAIEEEISHYEDKSAASIEALKIVQKHRGWVSDDNLKAIAAILEMSPAELDGVATFYNLIYRQPVGDNVIHYCNSVSCWVMGSDKVCQKLCERLNIKLGETTPDNRYTLLPIVCLGACDHAPTLMVNEDLYHDVDDAKIDQILGL